MFQRSRSAINHRQASLVLDRGYKTKLLVKHSTKELNLGKGEAVGTEDKTMSGVPSSGYLKELPCLYNIESWEKGATIERKRGIEEAEM